MSKYGKLLAAAVGLVAMALNDVWGISNFVGMEEIVGQVIISVLTALGVWGVSNAPQ